MKVHCSYDKLVPLADLKPHPKNRNKHPKAQVERLAKIFQYQGIRKAIVVSKRSGFITAGHGRLEAARLAGMKKYPVNFQDYDVEAQEYADLTADNAVAEWAELDLSGINADIGDLGPDLDIDLLGIKGFTVDVSEKGSREDEAPAPPKKGRSKRGEVYQLGRHRLMCGDSTRAEDVEKLMADDQADLVFTDPPYGVNYDGGHAVKGKRREKLANDHSVDIYGAAIPIMFAFSKSKAALYLWFACTKAPSVLQVLQDVGYETRSWIIWNKNMAQFGAIGAQYKQKHEPCLYAYKRGHSPFWGGPNNETSVWDVDRQAKNDLHPTQKPVALSRRAIVNSCPAKGIILDLFGGSGSTLMGAEIEGRSARLMELEPAYCDVILNRWAEYTGQDPVREDGKKWSQLRG